MTRVSPWLFLLCFLFIATKSHGVEFSQRPEILNVNGKYHINFALSDFTDVEVAVIDQQGKVVRHLAAGMLGANAPPPLIQNSLNQQIVWNGADDYHRMIIPTSDFRIRVRAGMSVTLESIAGGDPYAFFSKAMGQGDHAAWAISGLEAKPDGTVYVIGNANNYGPAALRAYDSRGVYQHTVYPPPSAKNAEAMKGWGIRVDKNGTYTFKYKSLDSPSPSTTLITDNRAYVAGIVPSHDNNRLSLLGWGHRLLSVSTDGTLPSDYSAKARLIEKPHIAIPKKPTPKNYGMPFFVANTAEDEYFYVSGLFEQGGKRADYSQGKGISEVFWREGRVYKVNKNTKEASIFFSLDESSLPRGLKARNESPIRDSRTTRYAAFHGIAVDLQNRVFICDRLNKRVLILDASGKKLAELPVPYPDAITYDTKSGALFVTSRYGNFHKPGELRLLKFDNWESDREPSVNILLLEKVGLYPHPSYLAVSHDGEQGFIWVAHTELPVQVYQNHIKGLKLEADFENRSWQQALDLQHIAVNKKNDDVYIHDGWGNCFLVTNWKPPQFEKCQVDIPEARETKQGRKRQSNTGHALGFAIHPLNDHVFLRAPFEGVKRYKLDEKAIRSVSVGQANKPLTPPISNAWAVNLGYGDRGMAIGPDGGLALLGSTEKNRYTGPLTYYSTSASSETHPVTFPDFGETARSAGVRFDARGNLYAGKIDESGLGEFRVKQDNLITKTTGKIYQYKPTGSLGTGNLFPTAPEAPSKIYNVNFGAIGNQFTRAPFFDVDGYGRIYYPSSLESRVSVIDNAGNAIVAFGTWGNRDSMGRLGVEGDKDTGIPLAYPSSIGATNDYIYVSDLVNIRLLRIRKNFSTEAIAAPSRKRSRQ